VSTPKLTEAGRVALTAARESTDHGGLGFMVVPTRRMPRKMADALYDMGYLESVASGHSFARGVSTLRITPAGRAALEGGGK
jgi:hypothetical protein